MNINISAALDQMNDLLTSVIAAIPNLIIAAIVFGLFYVAALWIKKLVQTVTSRSGLAASAQLLMGRISRWLVIGFGALVALSIVIPSFEPGQLIQLLGIGSIAIGFAFRDIAQNFLAGILILLTQPFQVNDQIAVGGYEGTVEEIQTRATVLKTYDGRRVVIPNSDLFTDSVTVNTAFESRRSEYDFGVGYEDDIDRAKEIILDVLHNTEGILDNPTPDLRTVDLAGSSVNIRARWWTKSQQSDVVAVSDKVITEVKKRLDQNGINIPFPIRTVYFYNETKSENGSAAMNAENGRTEVSKRAAVA